MIAEQLIIITFTQSLVNPICSLKLAIMSSDNPENVIYIWNICIGACEANLIKFNLLHWKNTKNTTRL